MATLAYRNFKPDHFKPNSLRKAVRLFVRTFVGNQQDQAALSQKRQLSAVIHPVGISIPCQHA